MLNCSCYPKGKKVINEYLEADNFFLNWFKFILFIKQMNH